MIKSLLGACTLCPHPKLLKSDKTRDTIPGLFERGMIRESSDKSGRTIG